ncbi:MAG: SdpI family protein [Lachnospiraceae bacterium]|nr:SdpI family protein [Lachnospiraceae bacterium]
MWFWWFMLIFGLMIPMVQIVAGRMMWKHHPKQINWVYGYRTKRSMKNMDTWVFAHEHCGRIWWKTGLIMLIPSVLIYIPFYHSNEDTIGIVGTILCVIQLVVLIASIFPTERALKKTFNDDGMRR